MPGPEPRSIRGDGRLVWIAGSMESAVKLDHHVFEIVDAGQIQLGIMTSQKLVVNPQLIELGSGKGNAAAI